MVTESRRRDVTTDGETDCTRLEEAIVGSILGTAIGDALGLPYEGLSRRRAKKVLGLPDRHRLFVRRGMVSDDTEQSCLVAQALIESFGDVGQFQRRLLRRLQGWLLTVPGGIGLGTLRAISKSLIGFPPHRCGVFSAGNGPSMRSAILGAAIEDPRRLRELVHASCTITHTDPKAFFGALAVAMATNLARRESLVGPAEYFTTVQRAFREEPASEFLRLLEPVVQSVEKGQSTAEFASSSGMSRGVSGYVYQTVPVALQAWLSNQNDFRQAIIGVIECGGDTDTTAAIVGGIVGCHVHKAGIPEQWVNKLLEWPRTPAWMEQLAKQLARVVATNRPETPVSLPLAGVLARNAVFLAIVLSHGFRRLLPPY
jgi:ADP-ribosyl-[dinitrogen reductase] hydrolase